MLLVHSGIPLLPGLDLVGCMCPGIYLILLDFLVNYVDVFVVFSDGSLYFCGISSDLPLSVFIASIEFFSLFFFISLASSLLILLIFSKNQLLDLLIF